MTTQTDQPITLTANGQPRELRQPPAPLVLRLLRVVCAVVRWVVG
jgi:hypothetical protein